MINIINKDLMKIILIILYILFTQASIIDVNHPSKIWLIIPIIIIFSVKAIPIKMLIFMGIIPLALLINLLFESKSNLIGWQFVTIHLGCAVLSFILVNNKAIKNYFTIDKICFITLIFGSIVITSTVIEFLIGLTPGRIIYGSQNLTSLTLTILIPIVFSFCKNIKIKFLYITLSILSIVFLIKSRGLSITVLALTIFYLWSDLKNLSKILRIFLVISFACLVITIGFLFNDRFNDLIHGNSLYFRLYAWERFVNIIGQTNILFGNGPSNIAINFNEFQFLNPQIELISGLDTFYNPHSDWIFMLSSGGIFLLVIYLSMNIFLNFKFFFQDKAVIKNKFLHVPFVMYLILLFSAQYDITNTTFSILLSFYIIQAILFTKLVNEKLFTLNHIILKLFLIISLTIPLFFQSQSIDFTKVYSKFVYSQLFSNSYEEYPLNDYASHFKISDTLKTYHYLNTAGDKFNEDVFANLIINSRKYNKYLEPSLHMSTQYYSIINDQQRLLEIYSDLFYVLLIDSKMINISFDPKNVKVILGSKLSYEKTSNQHTFILTKELSQKLMHSGASFGKLKIDNYIGSSFTINSDDSKELLYKNVVNNFFVKLNSFTVPLTM